MYIKCGILIPSTPTRHPSTRRTVRRRVSAMITGVIMALGFIVATQGQAQAAAFTADCPPVLHCVVVPAAYAANGGNIEDYGNYDDTDRPKDMAISSIVIHDTEGSLQATLNHFRDSMAYVSAHYVVDQDGTVYQMVPNEDMAWHAGNWWYNMHSVAIEHVGHAAAGGTEYTSALYRSSAELVRYLSAKYDVPRDRDHIIGHDNVPAPKASGIAGMHVDPGPFWNWQRYMTLIGAPVLPGTNPNSSFITVAPVWPLNKQLVTGCFPDVTPPSCAPAGLQPTNFAYLRTEPRRDAPLFTDPVLGQGTTDIGNSAARVFYGQTFAIADRKISWGGMWYRLWVNGRTGWLYSPWTAPTAFPADGGKSITPKTGRSSIPVYGRPSPETSAYPPGLLDTYPASFWIPAQAPQAPLPYQIGANQRYRVIDAHVPNDHFYAWSITADRTRFPFDHTVFEGQTEYVQVSFGGRQAFVKAADVDIR